MNATRWKKLLLLMLVLLCFAPGTQAQNRMNLEKPVMENVFFNVIWGSALGALLNLSITALEAEVVTRPKNADIKLYKGATVGGLVGLASGLLLVGSGVTFDPNQTLLVGQRPAAVPFRLYTSPHNPKRITGFSATVLNMRF